MKITHLQSSTQIVNLGEIKVLTDPWLTEGEYLGSWYHYPPFGENNLAKLEYDFIYVSHIHPDHLSEQTFHKLPLKKPVLIHRYKSKFVKRKLEMLGYEVVECDHAEPYLFNNGSSLTIYAADDCNPRLCGLQMGCAVMETKFESTGIDTLAVFQYENKIIFNTNDCPFDLAQKTIINNRLDQLDIDLLLVGYAGAGPFPQCFEFDNIEDKLKAAKSKEIQFLTMAVKYIKLLQPSYYAPFAGTYILGSRLSTLTKFRGVPSIEMAVDFIDQQVNGSFKGVILKKLDQYDIASGGLTEARDTPLLSYDEYISQISNYKLSYDNDNWEEKEIIKLIGSAYLRFQKKSKEIGFTSKTKIIIQTEKITFDFSFEQNVNISESKKVYDNPFIKISLDHNLLHRLLRGPKFAHWNNAEIGSHLRYVRKPDIFERGLHHCLYFFHE